ncbi:MAG: porphobilinogen synthase [Myxococcales bacterium]|nr:porphobilinogen synthase [Myxococcales bacterium]
MPFPTQRPRRLRKSDVLRSMVRETHVRRADLIYPMFVEPGSGVTQPIHAMPGQNRYSVDTLVEACKRVHGVGIPAVILFGIPETKDPTGKISLDPHGIVQRAVEALKSSVPGLFVITDVCLCEYTSHGHCGVIVDGDVANDPTLELLARQALSHAEAGADMVAPSDMMDGRVGAIRRLLDEKGHAEVPIMSYAVKYASGFYGPFREAAESAPQFGDRRSYQMDPANTREAMREARLDAEEGADILMVKPALPYLDVIRGVREAFDHPVAAYCVSGEYSMIKAAGANGWIDADRVALEVLTAIKRAGADLILTYSALDLADKLD